MLNLAFTYNLPIDQLFNLESQIKSAFIIWESVGFLLYYMCVFMTTIRGYLEGLGL